MTQKDRVEFWLHMYECSMGVHHSAERAATDADEAIAAFRKTFNVDVPSMPEARGPDRPLVDYSKVIGGPGQTTPYLACRSNT